MKTLLILIRPVPLAELWFRRYYSEMLNCFANPIIAPLNTGAVLKATRESKGLTVEALSELTRVRRGLIEAIESEYFESLPDPVFTKGHISQIARTLGLPEEEVVTQYMSQIPARG